MTFSYTDFGYILVLEPGDEVVRCLIQFAREYEIENAVLSGVGSVWPLLRSHSLLNNLQPVMGKTPLVMFYPGRYDGQQGCGGQPGRRIRVC